MSENLQKYRYLQHQLPQPEQRVLVLITGARQTGKTTLARFLYPDLNYLNLDAPEYRELVRQVHSENWHREIGHAILDEAQKEPVVFDKVKFAFDAGKISFQVLLGSSQIQLLKNVRESLAGRVTIYEIWPLMLGELISRHPSAPVAPPLLDQLLEAPNISDLLKHQRQFLTGETAAIAQQMERYLLKWGGMPPLLHLTDTQKLKWLKDYERTYLERDLADLARLNDLIPFRKLQRLTALRSAGLLNYSELARDAGISVDTTRRYLQYLQISYQSILIQPFYKNLTSSLIKSPKIFWLDVGLLRTLTGHWGEVSGQIYETMVVGECIKWIRTLQKPVEYYFYRTRSGMELDLLLETPTGFLGFEIKAREVVTPSDATVMKRIAGVLGKAWKGGVVVYRGNSLHRLTEPNIWAIPSWRLFS